MPNSPNAGSDMLTDMTTSFLASNKMGEAMKLENIKNGIVNKKSKPDTNNDD